MNYRKYILGIVFLFLATISFSQEIKFDGVYQGESLYLVNPFSDSNFCIDKILINGKDSEIDLKSSTIEINFQLFGLKVGDAFNIIIKHKAGCKPKAINPKVIQVKSTFRIKSIKVGRDKVLRWTTTDEAGSLDYIVEQYRWKKWTQIGLVKGAGKQSMNHYQIKITDHSGENKFRVKQIDYSKRPRYSKSAIYRSLRQAVSYKKTASKIIFTGETSFEIYDCYGKIVTSGNASEVDISKLKKGAYFINYDNKMDTFKKK